MMLTKRQIESNGFSDWQGEMVPRSSEEKPGKCLSLKTLSALILLFIRFGFLSKLSFEELVGVRDNCFYYLLLCNNNPKTEGL